MKKIPTLFVRDPDNPRAVLPKVTPGCEWVLAGEGVATRKYDGICVRITPDGQWWARRDVRPGKVPPSAFVPVQLDDNTGKLFGWEPIEQTGWVKYLNEAIEAAMPGSLSPATYELCGPKVNRNPENYAEHCLIRHADAELAPIAELRISRNLGPDVIYARLGPWLVDLGRYGWEGVVWHHPDGRMAKLKARDFR